MDKDIINKKYSVVVVGGGMAGVCTAIASARSGADTALIQNRPVLGGNASSEIRMHICGADYHGKRENARETGIIEEILLENRKRNPQYSYSVFDTILWEKTNFQENLDLYLNTHMTKVFTEKNIIKSIEAEQLTTEKKFLISGEIFIDSTGDGTLSYLSDADYMSGREGKEVFGETYAPEKSDDYTMGNTLLFATKDMKEPVEFEKPEWANTYTEEDLKNRNHGAHGYNYWWIEVGGEDLDTISDAEEIRDELLKAVYGVWDHIKNHGDHKADNYALDWVGFLPGKRESRRIKGDYILKEQDLFAGKRFEDAVAYGGWPMDMHSVGGIRSKVKPTDWIEMDDLYTIPYRSMYSKNIKNLLLNGRLISVSHMAFGSTRVMATCSVIGQAVGSAAAMAVKNNISVKSISNNISSLQQKLLKDDIFIPGIKNEDQNDLAKKSKIKVSSTAKGTTGDNLINGYSRDFNNQNNGWISDENNQSEEFNEWVELEFDEYIKPEQIQFKFDSDLSQEIMLTMFKHNLEDQTPGIPSKIVKNYKITAYKDNNIVWEKFVEDNYLRFKKHRIKEKLLCNKIKVTIFSTNGDKNARIFEIRVY